jgi:hypothetical protein
MRMKAKTIKVFVDSDGKIKRICQKKHGAGVLVVTCKKPHESPADALWAGDVPADEFGDFRADLREAKKGFKKAKKKWQRVLSNLLMRPCACARISWLPEFHD